MGEFGPRRHNKGMGFGACRFKLGIVRVAKYCPSSIFCGEMVAGPIYPRPVSTPDIRIVRLQIFFQAG